MITGFNTDIEHGGVIYHVQTEDKGIETPIILSLVYAGGAILASKRSPYQDLIDSGFSDEALAERVKRQHRLICAAIHAGRIEDLKRMAGAGRDIAARGEPPVEADEITVEIEPPAFVPPSAESETEEVPAAPNDFVAKPAAYTIHDSRRQSPVDTFSLADEGLAVSLLNEQDFFYAGDRPTLRILVTDGKDDNARPLANVPVSVKILGTTFRPLIHSLKTDRDGIATVSAEIPQFTSGRAAVLIRASTQDHAAELRRVIHPRK